MANVKMLAFDAIVIVYTAIAIAVFVPWLLLSVGGSSALAVDISDAIFRFFSIFCHQLPYRSLFFGDIQCPVCARCASIYVFWLLLALLLAPTGIDGTTQLMGWRESTNVLRLITGAPYGLGYAYVLAWAVPFVYALLELIIVAAGRDGAKTDAVLGRVKNMAWPFTTATRR
jgi:uncharacterized membrane protein